VRAFYDADEQTNGRVLATASYDKTAKLWDVTDPARPGRPPSSPATDEVWAVAFAPNGRILAAAGDDKTARLWKTN
jgi:WD40 repeat protein